MGCIASTPDHPVPSGAALSFIRPSKEEVIKERRNALGEKHYVGQADEMLMGVLPLAAAFDKFDNDQSSGLDGGELRSALEHMGIDATSQQAGAILKQYDQYPDQTLDVKEFASVVRDIQLMVKFDLDKDGALSTEELLLCMNSLGFSMNLEQVGVLMNRFDADRNGTIDLIELSSLTRTAKAFLKYDTDQSGTIDIDELRDALRKLGLRAGGLEPQALFRRYDEDGNGSIELHEFAVLVRDLQLYASFDTNADGTIDETELRDALKKLGLR